MKLGKKGRWGVAALVLAVLGGAAFFGHQAYQRWQDRRSVEAACEGVLAHQEIPKLLGTERVRADEVDSLFESQVEDYGDPLTLCAVVQADDPERLSADVRWIHQGEPAAHDILDVLLPNPGLSISPLGEGWTGVFQPYLDLGRVVINLECANRPGRYLMTSVEAKVKGGFPGSAGEDRARVARIAAGTAERAAEKWGCETEFGGRIESVSAVASQQHPVAADRAAGNCRAAARAAAAWPGQGIEAVREVPSDPDTLAEECRLVGAGGQDLYTLNAYYGVAFNNDAQVKLVRREPYRVMSETAGVSPAGGYGWASADCPSRFGLGKAVFTAEAEDDENNDLIPEELDPEFLDAVLSAFAEQSAQRHGCERVRLPGED